MGDNWNEANWPKRKPGPTVRLDANGNNYLQEPGKPVIITPILHTSARSGCMVVDVIYETDGTPKLRAALYVGLRESGTYTLPGFNSAWLVDLPDGFRTPLDAIRAAIVNSPAKPPGPPDW